MAAPGFNSSQALVAAGNPLLRVYGFRVLLNLVWACMASLEGAAVWSLFCRCFIIKRSDADEEMNGDCLFASLVSTGMTC